MKAKLKPCPFCGFSCAQILVERNAWGTFARVHCDVCGAQVSGVGVMVGTVSVPALKADAARNWNTRTEPRTPPKRAAVRGRK